MFEQLKHQKSDCYSPLHHIMAGLRTMHTNRTSIHQVLQKLKKLESNLSEIQKAGLQPAKVL